MEQQPPSTPQSNPFSTMHKQRLYSFLIAVVAFITLFLPWISFGFLSFNGFHSWGWLSFLGCVAVIGLTFLGNKEMPSMQILKIWLWADLLPLHLAP